MNDDNASELERLRRDIDRIDSELGQLLVTRQAVSERIGTLKTSTADVLRPGREAQILRRLVHEIGGGIAPESVLRIWREILATSTRAQAAFAAAVCAPTGERALWDVARSHFGGATSLQCVDRPPQGLRAVADDSAQVAVLPPPSDDLLWWTGLIESVPRLHVVARLPFGPPRPGEGADRVEAFVVGRMAPDPSGDDISVLALNAAGGLSRGRLRDLLAEAGLDATWRAVTRPPASQEVWHLIEVDGFVAEDDRRLVELPRDYPREVERCVRLGAYARPLAAPAD